MPTYEYLRATGGESFEQLQNISAAPLEVRPECGGLVHCHISGGCGVIFKGKEQYAKAHAGDLSEPTCSGRDSPCCGREAPGESRPCGGYSTGEMGFSLKE
jgi:predicted nucleic acid-binding Zn ribbon protein